jgi:CRISPR-associated protein Cas1
MRPRDLHILPTVGDGLTFLYAEHVRVEKDQHAVALVDAGGSVEVPAAALSVLMLGPGSVVTHAAMTALAECGCAVLFTGEGGVRLYASGLGETRSATNLLAQARAWADPDEHLAVVRRMYAMRFDDVLSKSLTLEQIRGKEGVRVREAYAAAASQYGIDWRGRQYGPGDDGWAASSPANRALSTACACLYGLCHAAIVAIGLSPALGFVHTGKALSFVYDVADLYKCAILVPLAFRIAAESPPKLDSVVRRACRDEFRRTKLIERVVPDMQYVLGMRKSEVRLIDVADAENDNRDEPELALWSDDASPVAGGRNYAYNYTPPEHPHPEDEEATG